MLVWTNLVVYTKFLLNEGEFDILIDDYAPYQFSCVLQMLQSRVLLKKQCKTVSAEQAKR